MKRIINSLCLPIIRAAILLLSGFLLAAEAQSKRQFEGPLAVHSKNPLYFTDGSGKGIYLGGHQIFHDMQDNAWIGADDKPIALDWPKHMAFMEERGLNYLRNWITFSTGSGHGNIASPMPFARTGPGVAVDGQPKFDLHKFDEVYFKRLHDRVRLAQDRGIFVSIMLFEVYGFNASGKDKAFWGGNVFNGRNNVNGIQADTNGDSIGLEFFFGKDPALLQLQRDYVRKVIDTVSELDNVIFEVANECGATEWQHQMIDFIHKYERENKPKRHLVLMSPGGSDVSGQWINRPQTDVTNSHADVIAVLNGWGDYVNDPPANTSGRPAIMDMDHINPNGAHDPLLPWKALTRGYHYSLYDHPFENPSAEGVTWERVRKNAGAAVRYTRRFSDLARTTPHNDLSSTRYCLADPGRNYLVFQPKAGKPFTVKMEPGQYDYEWFDVDGTTVGATGTVQSGGGDQEFASPFQAPAVLFLNAAAARKSGELLSKER